ncbi:universal stress protein [Streptomyces sp. NPDC059740]|uniref:universal stress protein n=1 Tax=Streptomyces sp. NPDC059740 TaxID=3346926 RepID=UPI00365EF11B
MSPVAPPGAPVIVGVASVRDHTALAWAADEAARRRLPLRVVHSLETTSPPASEADLLPSYEEWHRTLRTAARRVLEEAQVFVRARRPEVHVSGLLAGSPAAAALQQEARTASMVVLGSGAERHRRFHVASVAQSVVAHAPCPVVVVREPEQTMQEPPHLVVGVDGGPGSRAAVDFAFEEAALRRARLIAVCAWHPPVLGVLDEDLARQDARTALAEATAGRAEAQPDVEVRHEVLRGHPVEVLVRESRHALAVITGTRGRGGFTGMLLGSVSQGLLHHAQCPVITVAGA